MIPPLPLLQEPIKVRKVGYDALEVTINGVTQIITRREAYALLGQLEREASLL